MKIICRIPENNGNFLDIRLGNCWLQLFIYFKTGLFFRLFGTIHTKLAVLLLFVRKLQEYQMQQILFATMHQGKLLV